MICDLFVTAVLRLREEHAHLHHKAGWATDQGILLLELAMLGLNSYNSTGPATLPPNRHVGYMMASSFDPFLQAEL